MRTANRAERASYGTGRERLLAAARELLVANGGDLDVEGVAARAGVSVSLIWRHFGNRSGLLVAMVEDFWRGYDDAVGDAEFISDADWREGSRTRLRRTIDFLLDDPLAPVVLGHFKGDAAVYRVNRQCLERQLQLVATNISLGQEAGEIKRTIEPGLTAALIVGGLHQAVVLAMTAPGRPDRAKLTEELWVAVAAILQLPSSAERRSVPCE
jgi:AcrR family transcriptional regulator